MQTDVFLKWVATSLTTSSEKPAFLMSRKITSKCVALWCPRPRGTFLRAAALKDSTPWAVLVFWSPVLTKGVETTQWGQRRATRITERPVKAIIRMIIQWIKQTEGKCTCLGEPIGTGRHLPSKPCNWELERCKWEVCDSYSLQKIHRRSSILLTYLVKYPRKKGQSVKMTHHYVSVGLPR